ncbi:hypothetical protein DTO013E5_1167 [Penicillium roqueforti]|uniref:uncharacterized protein n=1 Tax=Penicillium roqueforti TaxID=5082 RepID=UPI00190C114D|nr:uncharacterized protein LCP9604111_2395 [Penicillium roqueforti]KAF9252399.1 hypothetical protein LCP9604111_2395 [Penicillium roqueforti]KAI1837669.1 hypothetical protein CBS147337_1952 [Penicillium roqueforti]KAI2721856.1 hypothetical protein CBS147318_2471 [Penicillium roqueforti]KAI2747422.1 hypothetical protein DTO012A1_68 [Penicillium roqueforti]KAI2748517.1 hypothetical protein DTO013F2_6488 [Penicillium roqueforti]
MSTTDHPESGANTNRDINQPPTTTPQDQQQTSPTTELQAQTDLAADTSIPSAHDQTPMNQIQIHPATGPGGESEFAPETTSPTTNPSQTFDNEPAVALAKLTTSPSMDTDERKNAPETSTEHSDDGSGKEVEEDDAGPALVITLLLTTGSRHPFTIDGNYLRKRSVNVENFDPFLMSVYTLKELIWREWRPDWETRPSSPSSIRLISFGKLLDDKSPISDSKFSKEHPNVIHMTVKPQEVVDDEDAKGTKTQYSREREASVDGMLPAVLSAAYYFHPDTQPSLPCPSSDNPPPSIYLSLQ